MTVLVTGGAGYIGAHVVRLLRGTGRDVLVADDLSAGDAARIGDAVLLEIDLADSRSVRPLAAAMKRARVREVIHFAARKRVDESVVRPLWYYRQNIGGLANVIAAMRATGADRLVFSSSAAVYGATTPVSYTHLTLPT